MATVTLKDLRDAFAIAGKEDRNALVARTKATLAAATFDAKLAQYMAERNAPSGFGVDIHGDGKLKPSGECAKPKLPQAEA